MATEADQRVDSFETANTGGLLTGFLADEDDFDRRALWRLGSWGAASVGAVIVALLANQSSIGSRRDQVAAADIARQSQQIQSVAKESQNEARRLALAIDTLNGDRDRLYSRVTVLEQGLDSVTGSIARQNSAAASPPAATPVVVWPSGPTEPLPPSPTPAPAPVASAVATTVAAVPDKPAVVAAAAEPKPTAPPAEASNTPPPTPTAPLIASKSLMAPPESLAAKLIEPTSPGKGITAAPMPEVVGPVTLADDGTPVQAAAPELAVQRTQFGVDVGSANSIGGLRALWRGLLKSRSNAALAALRPIIVVKESNSGLGMQLRLVAGPLHDAAAAAKICAALTESQRTCETTVFDGQRLAIKAEEPPPAAVKPAPTRRRHTPAKRAAVEEPAKKPETSTLSALFSRR
jgi:hypothetical protein